MGQQLCLAAFGIKAEIMPMGRANEDSGGGQFRAPSLPPTAEQAQVGRGPENTEILLRSLILEPLSEACFRSWGILSSLPCSL